MPSLSRLRTASSGPSGEVRTNKIRMHERLHRTDFHVTNKIRIELDDCDDGEKYAQSCDYFLHFDPPALSNAPPPVEHESGLN